MDAQKEPSGADCSDSAEDTNENRTEGGADILMPLLTQPTLADMERQRQHGATREVIINFLLQFITRAVTFLVTFLSSTFTVEHLGPQMLSNSTNEQEPKLRFNDNLKQSIKTCKHPAHKNIAKTALIREIPLVHFQLIVKDDLKNRIFNKNELANACTTLSARMLDRLLEIDERSPKNFELKLLSYQEWVDMLLKINRVLLKNMCEEEIEISRLMYARISRCNQSARQAELIEGYRRDMRRLIDFIKTSDTEGKWNNSNFYFETITVADLYNSPKTNAPKDVCF